MRPIAWTLMFGVAASLIAGAQPTTEALIAEAERLSRAGERPTLRDPLAARVNAAQSTAEDRTNLAVTVYNQNRALVRDVRRVSLLPGEQSLQFMDVAEHIQTETLGMRSRNAPGDLIILEQNYEYDLMSPEKLMEKYVGREVRLINTSRDHDFHEVRARLLSVNNGPIYEIDGEIYLGHPGNVVLPELPDELIARPTLVWLLDNHGADHEIEATYLTRGMNWKADYVLTFGQDDAVMDLAGWVTLDNQSGAAYENAELKLVAGDVHEARPEAHDPRMLMMDVAAARAPKMETEAFADFHLYTLPRRTTIRQNQSKQVSLLSASEVKVTRRYEYRGQGHYFTQRMRSTGNTSVAAMMEFENREENSMGMALPAGVMRVYQEDSSGALQFAGEDRVGHTPRNETVTLRLGNAFDLVGERVQTDYTRLSDRLHEASFEVTLRNNKREDEVVIDVIEPLSGDWEIRDASHEYEKRDAHTAVFSIPVPADGEVKVTYTVRVRH